MKASYLVLLALPFVLAACPGKKNEEAAQATPPPATEEMVPPAAESEAQPADAAAAPAAGDQAAPAGH